MKGIDRKVTTRMLALPLGHSSALACQSCASRRMRLALHHVVLVNTFFVRLTKRQVRFSSCNRLCGCSNRDLNRSRFQLATTLLLRSIGKDHQVKECANRVLISKDILLHCFCGTDIFHKILTCRTLHFYLKTRYYSAHTFIDEDYRFLICAEC